MGLDAADIGGREQHLTTIMDSLTICTFNCEGFSRSCHYMSTYLNNAKCDILCLQETWLLDTNIDKLSQIHDDYLAVGKSGIDASCDIIMGRPSGGVAILYKKSLAKDVTLLDIPSRRACAIKLCTDNGYNIIVICVYMPCDNFSRYSINSVYEDVINIIESIIEKSNCNCVIMCGDMNTSFSRRNAQTACLNNFVLRNNLQIVLIILLSVKIYLP
jgi:exonuclease III